MALKHSMWHCVWVLPKLFKLWPWVDLDPFYAKIKFGHIGFCMGKTENYLFFGNYCSLGSQSCLKHLTKWVNEVVWVSKVKIILWPWSKVTQIWPWILVCSIVYKSSTKVVQIMTLGWPWPILRQGQIWSHRLLYRKKWKLFILWKLLQPWVSKLLEAFS